MRVKEFISNEWVAYADYDNRRSLPHVMDGLKITQRKALYAATKLPKNEKPMKVSQFAGKAAELTAYHHGDTSMISTIIGLAQDYPGTNNYPLLEKHGQFGSRLSGEAAAPRYINTRLHKNWDRFFKPEDQQIVEYLYDDGEMIEPKYFIPVIPTILLNGCDGVGNGFKSSILNYEIEDIVKAIKEIIKYGKVKNKILPKIKGWSGLIEKIDKQVIFTGTYKKINSTKIVVTELPPSYDNDKYKKLLNKLIDEKFIKDYENRSTEDKWEWVLDCPRDTCAKEDKILLDKLGLVYKTSENFVCWGIDGNSPLNFDGPEELISYWFDQRIKLYEKYINHKIKLIKQDIIAMDLKIKFLNWCVKNDFKQLTKNQFLDAIITDIKKLDLVTANKFIMMPVYKITKDEIELISKQIEQLIDELEVMEATTPIDLMSKNLQMCY